MLASMPSSASASEPQPRPHHQCRLVGCSAAHGNGSLLSRCHVAAPILRPCRFECRLLNQYRNNSAMRNRTMNIRFKAELIAWKWGRCKGFLFAFSLLLAIFPILASRSYHSCVISSAGSAQPAQILCWGFGDAGAIGNGDHSHRFTPTSTIPLNSEAATANKGHPQVTADAHKGHSPRDVFSHNNRVPSQHGCPLPFIFPAVREANSTDRCCRSIPISSSPLLCPVAEELRVLDGPALQFYAEFACFFLPIILFLRTIPAACIARTMPASRGFRRQSALKWLNMRQPFLRRMAAFAVFGFFFTAAPTAESAVIPTWSTAQLSVVRAYLAATSVGNVAIFAGGSSASSCSFCVV